MTLIVYRRQNRVSLSWHAILHKNLKLTARRIAQEPEVNSLKFNYSSPCNAIFQTMIKLNATQLIVS